MNGIDIFSAILGFAGLLLVVWGGWTLSRRDLEIGALFGAVPVAWGLGAWALAALLFALQHVHISFA